MNRYTKIALVVAMVVLAVAVGAVVMTEMRRSKPAAKPPAKKAPDSERAARAATAVAPIAAPPAASASSAPGMRGVDLHDAFAEFDVSRALTRVAPKDQSSVDDSFWLKDFHDAHNTSHRPINKEEAMRSANARPAQQMANGRADDTPKARTVGLSPMAFARKTVERPLDASSCIAFNDTETRHMLIDQKTNCMASENCPWQ